MSGADPHVPELDPDLAALAGAFGVATEYTDQTGVVRKVGAATIRSVLAAMDVDASTAGTCQLELQQLREERWRRTLPPSIVVRRNPADTDPWETWVHVEQGKSVRAWVDLEEGGRRYDVSRTDRRREPGHVDGRTIDEVVFRFPKDLPLGWHEFVVDLDGRTSSCVLVVTPDRISLPVLDSHHQEWGVATQIYSVRSHRSWGIGDLADLADLTAWFGRTFGADFILVNPLHASHTGKGMEPSPYLPGTRRFVNPIYLRIEQIPEAAYLTRSGEVGLVELGENARHHLNQLDHIDRDRVWRYKEPALREIFTVKRTPGREALFRHYRASEGVGLELFATWSALAQEYGPYWNDWPAEYQDCRSVAVAQFQADHREDVDFYMWLQWLLDEQMGTCQDVAHEVGMSIGVMHDLAVGVHRYGADTWSEPDVSAKGVTVGAPPDAFNQVGQDWSQPPRRPDRLAETGYRSYRDMLRTLLRNSGGLRIDHVLGLFRLWWIPEGMPASQGTYVRYDHHAMVNILALEAQRANAVIVGEDLGTVEPWVQTFLSDRGILGTTILWFERDDDAPKDPTKWRRNTMAAVTVHDLPPTLGYLAGDHVELRSELNLLTRESEHEWAAHAEEIAGWRAALERNSLIRSTASDREVVAALHRYITWSPSKLLSVSLPDLVGQRATQNQPGTTDEYPNWRIPLADSEGNLVFLEDLPDSDSLRRIVGAIGGSAAGT